ncbi:leaf rust 10 disease-resistance locus receptor-like protein kinase-like 2.8 [Quercus suber]|uniref:Leaf rust 10 disease-resistance locus receptor-like protein kinase-like 2.8 n=1 Tax=Quercus suber TaxID=58331 RepID=A0AAW0KZV5_QUESU
MEAHHLALSSLITLSFFLAILPPSYCTEDARFVECSHLYERGRIKNVYYPFWGGNQTEYCGRQGFKLECYNNEYPIIKFEELEFLILNISESQDVMTIARLDLCGGIDANNNAYFVNESSAKIHFPDHEQCREKIRVPILRNAIDESVAHHLALSSLITLSFFLAILPPSYCTEDAALLSAVIFMSVEESKTFITLSGGNQTEYCGRQGFKLECYNNEYPIIKFEELSSLY